MREAGPGLPKRKGRSAEPPLRRGRSSAAEQKHGGGSDSRASGSAAAPDDQEDVERLVERLEAAEEAAEAAPAPRKPRGKKPKSAGGGASAAAGSAARPRRHSSRVQNNKGDNIGGSDARAGGDELELEEAHEDDDDGEEDSEEDHGGQDSTADGSGPGGSGPGGALSMLAAGAAAVEKKLEHKSRVWDVFSPTGFPLGKERVAKMDHKDGKPWEVEVWNMLVDPQPPNDEVNFQSVGRFYEHHNRALMTVVHMGTYKDDALIGIEPHDRLYPTGFYQRKGEFKGTILSCVDLIYCDGPDLSTPYNEWRGSQSDQLASNTKRFISEICAGYYVKLNTDSKFMKDKAMWAVLYAFRPWASPYGEPQVAVMKMKEGKMVTDAPVKHINACDIVAVGGLTNSLCNAVCAWLTDNMPCFKSIRTEEQLTKGATPRSEADVGRALEESLGILDLELCRKRFVVNMRAYADELMTNQRLLLGIREGELKWTKVEEGKENEEITATINKATTKFDKWWIRQLLRTCETICTVTEFGGKTNNFSDKPTTLALMQVYELLMTDHEEEILSHLSNLDYDDDAIAKAYQILPLNQAIHKLVNEYIQETIYVPAMFADVLIAMSTETTADNSLAQLKDATAWVPKQMRLMYKNMKQYYKDVNPEPTWVKEIKDQHAKDEEESSAKIAAAFGRIGMRPGKPAPGDPGLGGLKPAPTKSKAFDPKKRGLGDLPKDHIDDYADFDDGKTNKTRLVGTYARFKNNNGGRSQKQLHRWCICDQSKLAENKDSLTFPGHWVSTQASSSIGHSNPGKDGCSYNKFVPDPEKEKGRPGSGKGKGKPVAATSSDSMTIADADLKRATSHIENLENQIRMLAAARDAEHLKYAKATELANTQLGLQAKETNDLISAHARTLRSSQQETFNAITKINEIRGHAECFAENLLAKASQDKPVDMDAAWAAFSGVLTTETIEAAGWGSATVKVRGPRSINVFNIDAFESASAAAPPTPVQHAVYQLTEAKVNAHPVPDGYEAPADANAIIPWASAAATAASKKRKHGDMDFDAADGDLGFGLEVDDDG